MNHGCKDFSEFLLKPGKLTASAFLERLSHFRGFQDQFVYKSHKVGIYKKAQLLMLSLYTYRVSLFFFIFLYF